MDVVLRGGMEIDGRWAGFLQWECLKVDDGLCDFPVVLCAYVVPVLS